MTRFVIISDTHNKHHDIKLPEGDVLVHTGDFCLEGNVQEALNFMLWFENQPHRHKIFIAGNHDRCFELQSKLIYEMIYTLMPTSTYLEDTMTVVEGLNIFGSPWTPFFMTDWWRFHQRRGEEMRRIWQQIPSRVDVLLTHGPAYGTLDTTKRGDRAGDEALAERINELQNLKLHAFGHIHESYGMKETPASNRGGYACDLTSVNAAMVDLTYSNLRQPVVIDL